MKFSCEKLLLQNAVNTASRAVAAKSSIPALEGLLLTCGSESLTVSGYNMQTGIRTKFTAEVEETGELVVNARYLLMSCALSQRLSPDTPLPWRLLIAYDLTDEIFGLAIAQPGYLEVWYYFGTMCAAMPGWSIGTVLGVLMGNLMPIWAVSGCSVMLFGMFLAIIIPVGKQNRIVLGCIGVSFLCSLLASVLPFTRELSEGMRILVLTIVISAAAAILFPHKEDDLVA